MSPKAPECKTMRHARNGIFRGQTDEEETAEAEEDTEEISVSKRTPGRIVPRVPGRILPPPISPYHPAPKYTMDTIVTPSTIIPTCYFQILNIVYNEHEQAYNYTIRSLAQLGEQRQPDFTRTVLEDCLTSFEERSKLHELSDSNFELRNPNRITQNSSPDIEVGDSVSVRMNSTGEMDKSEWRDGTVVGMHAQQGLWSCFIVRYSAGRTMPCTERLLELVKKGTQRGRRFELIDGRDDGPDGRKVRGLRPVLTRQVPEFPRPLERFIPPSGICFGDAGKLG